MAGHSPAFPHALAASSCHRRLGLGPCASASPAGDRLHASAARGPGLPARLLRRPEGEGASGPRAGAPAPRLPQPPPAGQGDGRRGSQPLVLRLLEVSLRQRRGRAWTNRPGWSGWSFCWPLPGGLVRRVVGRTRRRAVPAWAKGGGGRGGGWAAAAGRCGASARGADSLTGPRQRPRAGRRPCLHGWAGFGPGRRGAPAPPERGCNASSVTRVQSRVLRAGLHVGALYTGPTWCLLAGAA